jgi:hypothetical protein
MLGLVISILTAAAPALPGAGVTCAEGADACELAPLVMAPREEREEWTYATPAVIDCSSPVVPLVLSALVGECDGTPHDASYWVSRDPESESSTAALAPASREHRGVVTSCDGLPQRIPGLALSEAQPIAVFATPVVVHVAVDVRVFDDAFRLPSRFGDPPDRPPRV